MSLFKLITNVYFVVVTITMLYSFYLAIYKKITLRQKYFYLYISLVFLCDVFGYFIRVYFKIDQFYPYFTFLILHVAYFGYFYYLEFQNTNFKISSIIISVISIILIIGIQVNSNSLILSPEIFIVYIFYNILVGLIWFLYIINNIDDISITSKQSFWISIALIFWSVFGMLRYIPIYSLFKVDREFLKTINTAFSFVNVATYIIYIKALKCTGYNVLRNFNYLKNK